MSDKAKLRVAWVTYLGLMFAVISGLWVAGQTLLAGGEILHEIKGLRQDVNSIKQSVNEDRANTSKLIRELADENRKIAEDQRKLDMRVQVLELFDGNRATRGLK